MKITLVLNDGEMDQLVHHMPEHSDWPELRYGMTLREALAELRRVHWGNIGGMTSVALSDGSFLDVELERETTGAELMNSQRVRRWTHDRYAASGERTIRYYAL